MSWTDWLAAVFAMQAVALMWLVVTPRVRLAFHMDLGLAMISLGMVMASISLYEAGEANIARILRFGLIGCGSMIAAVPLLIRRTRTHRRRATDFEKANQWH